VVAESFARIFFRNAVAIGLAVLPCPSVFKSFEEGDFLELDLEEARVRNLNRNITLQGNPLPQEMIEVLNKGGIPSLLKEMFGGGLEKAWEPAPIFLSQFNQAIHLSLLP